MTAMAIDRDAIAAAFAGLTDADYGLGSAPAKVYRFGETEYVKAQVSAICAGVKEATERIRRANITGTFRRDLLKYAGEVQSKPTPSRQRRHRIGTEGEKRSKLIAETGFDLAGIMCEPPAEQWARPEAQTLYHKLMQRGPGAPSVTDYEGEDLRHLAWMLEAELLDITEDGRIWLLSDTDEPGNSYPGAPVSADRARIGRTHHAEDVQALVMEVWQAILDGTPLMDIPAEYRREMTTAKGIRLGGRLITAHCNRLLAARLDRACSCLGRGMVGDGNAWDLPDHGENCPGRYRWLHVEVVRRAIRELVKSGELHRTDGAILTRKGHTEHRIPCAYGIPQDSGWHRYAEQAPRTRRRRISPLRKRLLGDDPAAGTPAPASDSAWEKAA